MTPVRAWNVHPATAHAATFVSTVSSDAQGLELRMSFCCRELQPVSRPMGLVRGDERRHAEAEDGLTSFQNTPDGTRAMHGVWAVNHGALGNGRRGSKYEPARQLKRERFVNARNHGQSQCANWRLCTDNRAYLAQSRRHEDL